MKKKLLSLFIVLCLTLATSASAMATSTSMNPNSVPNANSGGGDVTDPYEGPYDGSQNVQNASPGSINSYGFSTQTYDGTNWITDSDDNGTDSDVGDGTDIYVWAKITGDGAGVYKIDIAWGAMKFVFNGGDGMIWNPEKHIYEADPLASGSTNKEWVVTDYLDGTNNKIEVTNHSNRGVTAVFKYVMEDQGGDSPFNDEWKSKADSVAGGFYANNFDATDAAKEIAAVIDTGSGDVINATITGLWLKNNIWDNENGEYVADVLNSIEFATADEYNHGGVTDNTNKTAASMSSITHDDPGQNKGNGARTESVYFAFSGTPDDGKSASLNNFTKVGLITVTVSPNESPVLNSPAVVAP